MICSENEPATKYSLLLFTFTETMGLVSASKDWARLPTSCVGGRSRFRRSKRGAGRTMGLNSATYVLQH